MKKYPPPPTPGGNFASGAVWHTFVFKVPAFRRGFPCLGPQLTDVTTWSKILSSILITIFFDRTWFSYHVQCIITVGVVLLYTVAKTIKGVLFVYNLF